MLTKFRNQSVRGRLVRLVAIIVVPLTVVCSALAYSNYRTSIEAMAMGQSQVAEDFAFRTRLWFRGLLRTAETFSVLADRASSDADREALCRGEAQDLVSSLPAFEVLALHGREDRACIAAAASGTAAEPYLAESRRQLGLESLMSWGATVRSEFRYSSTQIEGAPVGMVQLRKLGRDDAVQAVSLFFTMRQLDVVFALGDLQPGSVVGLVQRGSGRLLSARGAEDGQDGWLPADATIPAGRQRWSAASRDGRRFVYAAHEVVSPDLVMVAAFSDDDARRLLLQLAVLAGAPFVLLLLFMAAYWRLVDRDIGRSIETIESVANVASQGDFQAAAVVDDEMPLELRRAFEAVNQIIQAASRRQDQLMASAARNQELMRELHHRVKNSLQVIQSYLAITRRQASNRESDVLREAEAKVQVLSVAYRFALTDQGLRPVPVRLFLAELLASMANAARHTGQWIVAEVDTRASLEVDRVIPLGLAMAEAAFTALRSPAAGKVLVQVTDDPAGIMRAVVSVTGAADGVRLNERTLRGLRLQLGALQDAPEQGEVLRWAIGSTAAD
jgi:two-component system, sensor histidine kinase PdtaS